MVTKTTFITILVTNHDEAKKFYTEKLGFAVWSDQEFGSDMRWLVASPQNENECRLTLVKADTAEKQAAVGKQAPGHVLVVFETDDILKSYEDMKKQGVAFHGEPKNMPWGQEVVFEDLYGNLFDLVEPAKH